MKDLLTCPVIPNGFLPFFPYNHRKEISGPSAERLAHPSAQGSQHCPVHFGFCGVSAQHGPWLPIVTYISHGPVF